MWIDYKKLESEGDWLYKLKVRSVFLEYENKELKSENEKLMLAFQVSLLVNISIIVVVVGIYLGVR